MEIFQILEQIDQIWRLSVFNSISLMIIIAVLVGIYIRHEKR